jgi:hypothetical protein
MVVVYVTTMVVTGNGEESSAFVAPKAQHTLQVEDQLARCQGVIPQRQLIFAYDIPAVKDVRRSHRFHNYA